MKVLVVGEQLRRRVPGGIGTYVRGLAQGLRDLGPDAPDVTTWASRAGRGADALMESLGFPVRRSPLPGWAMTRAWDLGLRAGAPPLGFGAVHATSLAVPTRPDGTRTSAMVHDLAWRAHPEAYPPRGRRWHEAALARAIARADVLMVPSSATADDLIAAGAAADRVEVVAEGSDHLPAADHDAARKLLRVLRVEGDYLLTVSTLEPRKNLARVVAAYLSARDRLPAPWPLVVVGPAGWVGAGGEAILPEGTDLPTGVVRAGPVPAAVLSALYEGARLLAYVPLLEGFGLPVLEAMRAGTPVVASRVPSAGDAARAVDPDDVASIADGLVEGATDEGARRQLIDAGRARAAALTWERSARRHAELWRAMVGA